MKERDLESEKRTSIFLQVPERKLLKSDGIFNRKIKNSISGDIQLQGVQQRGWWHGGDRTSSGAALHTSSESGAIAREQLEGEGGACRASLVASRDGEAIEFI